MTTSLHNGLEPIDQNALNGKLTSDTIEISKHSCSKLPYTSTSLPLSMQSPTKCRAEIDYSNNDMKTHKNPLMWHFQVMSWDFTFCLSRAGVILLVFVTAGADMFSFPLKIPSDWIFYAFIFLLESLMRNRLWLGCIDFRCIIKKF